jgi:thioredoxin-like negative regulator of GroEL
MSGLLFLSADDFVLTKGMKGNILTNSIPGFSLILFYSIQCQHCQNLIPIFKKLPSVLGGCQFGLCNINTNRKLIALSNETIAPITYVPYIVLYVNSRPFLAYKGPHDINEIKRFVVEVADKIQKKQKFSAQQEQDVKENVRGKIPAFSVGIPLYGSEDEAYFEFSNAYVTVRR